MTLHFDKGLRSCKNSCTREPKTVSFREMPTAIHIRSKTKEETVQRSIRS